MHQPARASQQVLQHHKVLQPVHQTLSLQVRESLRSTLLIALILIVLLSRILLVCLYLRASLHRKVSQRAPQPPQAPVHRQVHQPARQSQQVPRLPKVHQPVHQNPQVRQPHKALQPVRASPQVPALL